MKRFKIIPAIDIINGECVRLTKGDYSQKTVYGKDPGRIAQQFYEMGFKRLHVVDLDGAKANNPINLETLKNITKNIDIEIQFGGGIKSAEVAGELFKSGVKMIICGSIAVENPNLFKTLLEQYGGDRVVLSADFKKDKISIKGWLEESDYSVNHLIEQFTRYGLRKIICTDISKDGMLAGPSFEIYKELKKEFPQIEIIASGGISSLEDIKKLYYIGVAGVIVGKAIYENKINPLNLITWLEKE